MFRDPRQLLICLSSFGLVISVGMMIGLYFAIRRRGPGNEVAARMKQLLANPRKGAAKEATQSTEEVLQLDTQESILHL